jgi:membrane-bound lytic murein transglycosylase B
MKALLALLLFCCLAGCEGPGPSLEEEAARKAAAEKKLAEAGKQFAAFIDEAAKGAELLESRPDREAIDAEVKKLQELLDRASSVYPSHDSMSTLADDGRRMMNFFHACLGMAIHQSKRKDIRPEDAKRFIDETCKGNAGAIRQLIEIMKKDQEKVSP